MNTFFILIWTSGMFAMPGRKLGFWGRVVWPVKLGEALHEWAVRNIREDY